MLTLRTLIAVAAGVKFIPTVLFAVDSGANAVVFGAAMGLPYLLLLAAALRREPPRPARVALAVGLAVMVGLDAATGVYLAYPDNGPLPELKGLVLLPETVALWLVAVAAAGVAGLTPRRGAALVRQQCSACGTVYRAPAGAGCPRCAVAEETK